MAGSTSALPGDAMAWLQNIFVFSDKAEESHFFIIKLQKNTHHEII
jgi:hypothetical protein